MTLPVRRLLARAAAAPLALLLLAASDGGSSPAPRPLSPAEKAGAQVALDYLGRGPDAVVSRLSKASPFHALPAASLAEEIEVRLGPPAGARWRLVTTDAETAAAAALFSVESPGGLGDGVLIRFDPSDLTILEVRSLAEPESSSGVPGRDQEIAAAKARWASRRQRLRLGVAALSLLLAAIAVPIGLSGRARGRRIPRRPGRLVAASVLGLAGLAGIGYSAVRLRPLKAPSPPPVTSLAELLPLRRALAAGDFVTARRYFAEQKGPPQVRLTWEALEAVRRGDLKPARATLDRIPPSSGIPLAEVARAELAFATNDNEGCARAWDAFFEAGPDHDELALSAARMLAPIDYEDRATWLLDRALSRGSRNGEIWIEWAVQRTYRTWKVEIDKDAETLSPPDSEAEAAVATGWGLSPLDRDSLFSHALLWYYLAGSKNWKSFALESPSEPIVPPSASTAPAGALVLPAGASARTCGDSLRILLADGQLRIDGGASLAPAGTPAEDAGAATREEEERALAQLAPLIASPPVGDAWDDPSKRRLLVTTTNALARRGRWAELAAVTEGMPKQPASLPSDIVRLRAEALHQLDRPREQRELLLAFATGEANFQRRDPGTLLQLAEVFVAEKNWELAQKYTKSAFAKIPVIDSGPRLRRIEMLRKLEEAYESQQSAHFELRSPKTSDQRSAARVLEVLEAERTRIGRWIPLTGTRHPVDLLEARDFFRGFSEGSIEVVGLYDGRVRLPLANIFNFRPEFVAILTHELAHALIAEATRGRAPKWFHEGLAQHVEMREFDYNPMPDYVAKGRLLSLTAVEGVLGRLPQPEVVAAAYDESVWAIRYIQATRGDGALRALIAAFGDGASTEEAIRKVLGREVAEFDADLQRWWATSAPKEVRSQIVRYPDLAEAGWENVRKRIDR